MSRVVDETGKIYGDLTVLMRAGSLQGKAAWKCKCTCGREKVYTGDQLRQGKVTSCGECFIKKEHCSKIGRSNFIDLTGTRFGKLVVIEQVKKPDYISSGGVYWKCKCDCGNFHVAEASNLKKGNILSCGCLRSKGEEIIAQILKASGINYKSQYTEQRFKLTSGYFPHYDFAIFNEEKQLLYLIEYNGEQHYKFYTNKNTWNNEENFLKTQKRDQEKREICERFQIKLYTISYREFDKLPKILYNIIEENK